MTAETPQRELAADEKVEVAVPAEENDNNDEDRMRELYREQLMRMQCRNGGCGEGVFLG